MEADDRQSSASTRNSTSVSGSRCVEVTTCSRCQQCLASSIRADSLALLRSAQRGTEAAEAARPATSARPEHGLCHRSGRQNGRRIWTLWPSIFSASLLLLLAIGLCQGRATLPAENSSSSLGQPMSETDWRRLYDEPMVEEDEIAEILSREPVRSVGDVLVSDISIAAKATTAKQENDSRHGSGDKYAGKPRPDSRRSAGKSRNQRREYASSFDWEPKQHHPRRHRGHKQRWRRNIGSSSAVELWPNGTIPFAFSSRLKNANRNGTNTGDYDLIRMAIRKAMRIWEDNTCIRFVPYTQKLYQNWIVFKPPEPGNENRRCSSYIGMNYGIQPIYLGRDCQYDPGVIMHELGHVIGFHHEQKRPDREKFVRIFWKNMVAGNSTREQFDINWQIKTYNESYDLDSIMHYGNYYLSKRPGFLKTLESKENPDRRLGQRERLTLSDIARTNKMYGCPYPEQCITRKHPIRSGRLVSLMVKHEISKNLEHTTKWLSCRRQDGRCRRMNCGQLAEGDCNSYPRHCGSELFIIERAPGRLANHKVYGTGPVMLRAHVQPHVRGGRRRRRSNSTQHGFLTCYQKNGRRQKECRIVPCESNNPYKDCPLARFFFLTARRNATRNLSGNIQAMDATAAAMEDEILENTKVGLCQEDDHNRIQCVHCQSKNLCMLEDCGTRQQPSAVCEEFFIQLRQWTMAVQNSINTT
ncbi:uncharacterized protein LOC135811587 isoform X2 [Sycon ciliatum]